jgi:hypothetical protein
MTAHSVAGDTISGGVAPCEAIPDPNAPRYAQASVTLLRGTVTWKPVGQGVSQAVFPTVVVARISVSANQGYRFVVDPGDYVLTAEFPPPGNARPWTSVSFASSGLVVSRDIPDMCI